jgi:Uma2 family endonuclease
MIIRHPTIGAKRFSWELAGLSMSKEEFRAIEDFDDRYRYELIRGIVIVVPPASDSEVKANETLGTMLHRYAEEHPEGKCVDDTLFEREIETIPNLRRTDRSIWIGLGRVPDTDTDVPAIIVEFVSPGRAAFYRDYEEKRDEYLSIGVKEYWVIDRFDRTMTIFRRDAEPQVVKEGEVYSTSLMPGFELPLKTILAAADRYKK